jgi:hypothetical protein
MTGDPSDNDPKGAAPHLPEDPAEAPTAGDPIAGNAVPGDPTPIEPAATEPAATESPPGEIAVGEAAADRPAPGAEPAPRRIGRRRFLQASGAAAVAGGIAGAIYLSTQPQGPVVIAPRPIGPIPTPGKDSVTPVGPRLETFPIRPPAVPLAVRQPYLSTWLGATALPGTWGSFWTGHTTAMAGIVRIDGASYMFLGAPTLDLVVPNGNHGPTKTIHGFEAAMYQTKLNLTPTRSSFTLTAAGVELVVEFFSPVEAGDLRRQSIPMSYVIVTATSIDTAAHDVQLYLDISGEWCSGDDTQTIKWTPWTTTYSGGNLQAWAIELAHQKVLSEQHQMAAWGSVIWATAKRRGLTYQAGPALDVRQEFVSHGQLTGGAKPGSGAINAGFPVFAFSIGMGAVGKTSSRASFSIGQVRAPAVSYLVKPLEPLWSKYWYDWQSMLGFFHEDLNKAQGRADALDKTITTHAQTAGGTAYQGLCAISLRQAYGGTELVVGPNGKPWAFLKEISSDGDVSTVDVLFPASPAWLYADPAYLGLLLEPLLSYAESGKWTQPFAEHDLGRYPNATGYPGGGGENMPVEESANMIIMTAAYAQRVPVVEAKRFLKAHYPTLKKWADYLVNNLPDPGFQNQTDDFAGFIAHSVNLAIKGVVGVAAMGQIATTLAKKTEAGHYQRLAQKFVTYWLTHAPDPSGTHLDLTYNGPDGGDGTWGTIYNAYADSLLGTGLIPHSVRAEQAKWYTQVSNVFGVPLQTPHSYAKADWEMLTAAWLKDFPIKDELIEHEYLYANTTPSRVPFGDLYDTITGEQISFKARPVVGGIFALLALNHTRRRRPEARASPPQDAQATRWGERYKARKAGVVSVSGDPGRGRAAR